MALSSLKRYYELDTMDDLPDIYHPFSGTSEGRKVVSIAPAICTNTCPTVEPGCALVKGVPVSPPIQILGSMGTCPSKGVWSSVASCCPPPLPKIGVRSPQ